MLYIISRCDPVVNAADVQASDFGAKFHTSDAGTR